MKRIFALILVLLMISSLIMSCKKEDDPEDPSSSSSSTPSSSTPPTSSSEPSESTSSSSRPPIDGPTPPNQHGFSSKTNIMRDWEGKTLNVLCTRYGTTASAPWGQVELNPSSFGAGVGQKFDERQAYILETYGVTVKWIPAQATHTIGADLSSAELSESTTYDIAIPRVHEVQSLAASVYNMHESDYIDFTHDYYNIAAYEAFTVSGFTLFAAGGHDFADEQSSYTMLFNKDMLAEKAPTADLYADVRDGNWTYDALKSISTLVSGDDGNGTPGDEDTYGFGTKSVTRFYYYFGVFEADVDPDTGMYRFALNLDIEKAETVISLMKEAEASSWARTSGWGGSWGSNMHDAFTEGRLLFFNDVTQKITELSFDFAMGIVPFPKLNDEQEDYIVPVVNEQITVICIPRVTQDRTMSEYFVDVLSWTGNEYTVAAYYDILEATMDITTAEEDMDIAINYVFDKIAYDVGAITCGSGASLCGDIKERTLGDSSFTAIMQEEAAMLIETVEGWNNVWAAYDGDM